MPVVNPLSPQEIVKRFYQDGKIKSHNRLKCRVCQLFKQKKDFTRRGSSCKICELAGEKRPWKKYPLKIKTTEQKERIEEVTDEVYRSILQMPED